MAAALNQTVLLARHRPSRRYRVRRRDSARNIAVASSWCENPNSTCAMTSSRSPGRSTSNARSYRDSASRPSLVPVARHRRPPPLIPAQWPPAPPYTPQLHADGVQQHLTEVGLERSLAADFQLPDLPECPDQAVLHKILRFAQVAGIRRQTAGGPTDQSRPVAFNQRLERRRVTRLDPFQQVKGRFSVRFHTGAGYVTTPGR